MLLRSELMKSRRFDKRDGDYPNFHDVPRSMARESRRIFKVLTRVKTDGIEISDVFQKENSVMVDPFLKETRQVSIQSLVAKMKSELTIPIENDDER